MIIKIVKEIELDSEVWFKIYVDNYCKKCTQSEEVAKEYYTRLVNNAKNGYPIFETISEEWI